MEEYNTRGFHAIYDFYGVDKNKLNKTKLLHDYMCELATTCGAHVRKSQFNEKSVGITLSESHFTLHACLEYEYCAIDCYTCGDTIDPIKMVRGMYRILEPKRVHNLVLVRGDEERDGI